MNLQISNLNVGQELYFGNYSASESEAKQPVKWKVLDKQEDRILVLSSYILDAQPFHSESQAIRWENSSLRSWLNGKFYEEAFSVEEKKLIDSKETKNEEYAEDDEVLWQLFGLETVTKEISDAVFLLNYTDITTYFPGEGMSYEGISTEYTDNLKMIAEEKEYNDTCWWLRSSFSERNLAYIVSPCDSIGVSAVDSDNVQGVRPAMWLKIK